MCVLDIFLLYIKNKIRKIWAYRLFILDVTQWQIRHQGIGLSPCTWSGNPLTLSVPEINEWLWTYRNEYTWFTFIAWAIPQLGLGTSCHPTFPSGVNDLQIMLVHELGLVVTFVFSGTPCFPCSFPHCLVLNIIVGLMLVGVFFMLSFNFENQFLLLPVFIDIHTLRPAWLNKIRIYKQYNLFSGVIWVIFDLKYTLSPFKGRAIIIIFYGNVPLN